MSSSETEESEIEEVYDLTNPDVVTKYKAAAEICNKAVASVLAELKVGARVADLIAVGDKVVKESVAKIFKGKNIEKGVAFPTSISINNRCVDSVVGHFCPVESDIVIKDGDLVKIDLGCHIDGFIAVQAGTVKMQGEEAVKGREADLIQATRTAFQAALRLIRPGKSIAGVHGVLNQIAEIYGCNLVDGVMSHQLKRFVIDGNKCILNKPSPEHKVEDGVFEENEVYAVDIVMSTGDGKTRIVDEKETMIYKRALDREYNLRLKASRSVFSEINRKFPTMPFSIGEFEDQRQVRLGLVECLNHGLLHPYPVLHEKSGELVAQVKGTVLLMPSGSDVITKFEEQSVEPTVTLEDEEILSLLKEEISKKKKKKK